MTSTDDVLIVHESPVGYLTVPTPDGRLFVAARGVPVRVPADVAGSAPGEWESLPDGGVPDLDDGRAWRVTDGVWQVRDAGSGLLAQVDVWRRADVPSVSVSVKKAKEES